MAFYIKRPNGVLVGGRGWVVFIRGSRWCSFVQWRLFQRKTSDCGLHCSSYALDLKGYKRLVDGFVILFILLINIESIHKSVNRNLVSIKTGNNDIWMVVSVPRFYLPICSMLWYIHVYTQTEGSWGTLARLQTNMAEGGSVKTPFICSMGQWKSFNKRDCMFKKW